MPCGLTRSIYSGQTEEPLNYLRSHDSGTAIIDYKGVHLIYKLKWEMLGANGFFNRLWCGGSQLPLEAATQWGWSPPGQLGVTMGFTSLPSWPWDRWFRANVRVVPPLGQIGETVGRASPRPLPLMPSSPLVELLGLPVKIVRLPRTAGPAKEPLELSLIFPGRNWTRRE
jgi:hypothetical protein